MVSLAKAKLNRSTGERFQRETKREREREREREIGGVVVVEQERVTKAVVVFAILLLILWRCRGGRTDLLALS